MLVMRQQIIFNKLFRACHNIAETQPIILKKIIRIVDPYSKIKINSQLPIKIQPYNVIDCPDANLLRATIQSPQKTSLLENCLNININEKDVEITNKNNESTKDASSAVCLLEVPVSADIEIDSQSDVSIADLYSGIVSVISDQNIITTNLRSTNIDLFSRNGNISCTGLLLGQKINIRTDKDGDISLDNLQGDSIDCTTVNGDLNTNCCYVESSKFTTDNGNMTLKNIHKKSKIYVHEDGDLYMTGVHGNIQIQCNSFGNVNIQLSELVGYNRIDLETNKEVFINISEEIEKAVFIEAIAKKIRLQESLMHLSNCVKNGIIFQLSEQANRQNELQIKSRGILAIGKQSWSERLKMDMELKKQTLGA